MKNKVLTTASVFALMGATPAMADTVKIQTQTSAGADNIVDDAKEAIDDMKDGAAEAYEKIKATLIGKDDADKNMIVVIESRKTANGIIGHNVYNEKHESIATVSDIILDKDGKAMMVVVSDGMFIGMGKKAAFDYSAITRVESDGDVIMPVTQQIIDNAASFSTDKAEAGAKVRVIPDNGYSVATLLGGQLVNQEKVVLAEVENISFKNGAANLLILGFNKTLGMGGEKAVLPYADAKIVPNAEKFDFQLSDTKSMQFEAYKQALKH